MPLSALLSPGLIVSAVSSLLRFRDRVDSILSLKAATEGLPFVLPPVPTDDRPHVDDMIGFFETDQGRLILHLNKLEADLEPVKQDRASSANDLVIKRRRLCKLYYEATGVRPKFLGPAPPQFQGGDTQVASPGMQLAYYVVESQRLSRNSALLNILLVTSDTMLEFVGENANIFISNPKTRGLVVSLVDEFAVQRDFEDEGVSTIFKHLLGSTLLAVADNPGKLSDQPALKALFAALGEVRDQMGNDFVAGIVSQDGFEQLIGAFAMQVARDPSFVSQSSLVQSVLTATLAKIGTDFKDIVREPKALFGVLEVGLGAAATNVSGILEKKLGNGEPLLTAVLTGVLQEVGKTGAANQFFAGLGKDQFIKDLYRTTLTAVASNPLQFDQPGKVGEFASTLISGLAGALAQKDVSALFTPETLKLLAGESLTILSANPSFLSVNEPFAVNLLTSVFQAGAKAIGDGISRDDLVEVATVALRTSTDNLALLKLDQRLTGALVSIGDAIAGSDVKQLLGSQGRKDLLLTSLKSIAANPVVWGKFQEKDLVQPLVEGLLNGLASDPTGLLSGSLLVETTGRLLLTVMRQGRQLAEEKIDSKTLETLLSMALAGVNDEIGRSVDGENLPEFLERVVGSFLKAPSSLVENPALTVNQLVAAAKEDIANVRA